MSISNKNIKILDKLLYILIPIVAYLVLYAINFAIQNLFYLVIYASLSIRGSYTSELLLHNDTISILQEKTSIMYIMAALVYLVIFVLLAKTTKLLRFCAIETRKLLSGSRAYLILSGLLFGSFLNIALNVFSKYISKEMLEANNENISSFKSSTLLVTIFAVCVMAPIVEELIFRGFIYNCIKKLTGRIWIAAIVTSLLFGIFHGNILQGIYTGLTSLLLIFLYEKSKSIKTTIIFHGLLNFSSFLAGIIMYYTNDYISMIVCAIGAILGVTLFVKKCKKPIVTDNKVLI